MSISELFNTSNEWTKLKVDQISSENGGTLKGCDMKNCTLSDCNISSIVTKRENVVATPPAGYDSIFINSSNILSTKKDDGTITQYQKIGELPPIVGDLNMNNYNIINSNQISANGYISSNTGFKIEGAPLAYLLTDGSYSTASASQSNLYLYKMDTEILPPPPNGRIRFNSNILNGSCTHIYINHLTQDALDIENIAFNQISQLDIVYIQNRDASSDYVKYNVISRNILIEQYVDITVSFNSGTVTSFNDNHNLIFSVFTNDIELNNRLTSLETKAQNITATDTGTFFTKSLTHRLRSQDLFEVQNSDTSFNTITISRFLINCRQPLLSISTITSTGFIINGTGSSFLKSDGTTDGNSYALQSSLNTTNGNISSLSNNLSTNYTNTVNSDLKYATIINLNNTNTNITNLNNNLTTNYSTSATNETIYQKISNMSLYTTNANLTTNYYTNLTSDNKYFFKTGGILSGELNMSNNKISSLGEPVNINDATTKNYTDTRLNLKLNSVPTLIQQGGLKWAKVNPAVTQGSAVGVFDLIGTPLSTAIVGSTTFAANEITPFSIYVITVGGRITLPSNSQCTLSVTMNGAVVDPISFGNNPNLTGGGFECKFTWTFRAGGVLSTSIIHNIGGGSQNTTAVQGGGGTVTINTSIVQVMGVQFASPTFTTPNITCYTITCVKL